MEFELGKLYFSPKRDDYFRCLPANNETHSNTSYIWQADDGSIWTDGYVGLETLKDKPKFEPGKVYFSKKLQQPVFRIQPDWSGVGWISVSPHGGFIEYYRDEQVGNVEGPMVRLCHYESAMTAAERVLALGLDIVTQRDV